MPALSSLTASEDLSQSVVVSTVLGQLGAGGHLGGFLVLLLILGSEAEGFFFVLGFGRTSTCIFNRFAACSGVSQFLT